MTSMSELFYQYREEDLLLGEADVRVLIDPSGYVYDSVTKNRIPDVKASAYWIEYDGTDKFWDKKPADNVYGTLWKAAEYDQVNPQMTDTDGRYQWDVPEGWWRVKYEKSGYKTTWSDWLPVPPPQMDVNIAMESTTQPAKKINMHRLYNPNSWEHFYTGNEKEKDALVKMGWQYEGVGWIAPEKSNTPVYRLYNPNNGGDHHYTKNKKEYDALVKAGWTGEGVRWYSDDKESVPVYREYNPGAPIRNHNYTAKKNEGIGWYGVK